jgi:hypothetical protein
LLTSPWGGCGAVGVLFCLIKLCPWCLVMLFSVRSSKGFLISWVLFCLLYIAFWRIWQHGECSYGAWQWFAYNSAIFQSWIKI